MKQTDQYEWITAYLKGRGLQTVWQRATFAFTASQAVPMRMAERLRQAIAAVPFPITASIGTSGVALDTSEADTQLIDDLISTSDAAMYEAKRAGGNQVCHYPALLRRPAG